MSSKEAGILLPCRKRVMLAALVTAWLCAPAGARAHSVEQEIEACRHFSCEPSSAAHIANAIYFSDRKTKIEGIAPEEAAPQSIASQIKELLALKESGALTDEEFNLAKSRLITSN